MEAFLITLSVLGSPHWQSTLHCCSCYQGSTSSTQLHHAFLLLVRPAGHSPMTWVLLGFQFRAQPQKWLSGITLGLSLMSQCQSPGQGCSTVQCSPADRHRCWSGLQLSLGPWANPSKCKKPLPAPTALMHILWQLFLCWVLQASDPRAPCLCELSPGTQRSSSRCHRYRMELTRLHLATWSHPPSPPWEWEERATSRQGHSSPWLTSPVQQGPPASPLGCLGGPCGCTTAAFALQDRLNHGHGQHRGLGAGPAAGQGHLGLRAGFHSRAHWLFLDQHEALLPAAETRLSTTHSCSAKASCYWAGQEHQALLPLPSKLPQKVFPFPQMGKRRQQPLFFSASSRNMLSWNMCSHFISHSYNEFAPLNCFANTENKFLCTDHFLGEC